MPKLRKKDREDIKKLVHWARHWARTREKSFEAEVAARELGWRIDKINRLLKEAVSYGLFTSDSIDTARSVREGYAGGGAANFRARRRTKRVRRKFYRLAPKFMPKVKNTRRRHNPTAPDAEGENEVKRMEVLDYYIKHCGIEPEVARSLVGTGRAKATKRGTLTPAELKVFDSAARRWSNPVTRTILRLLPRTGMRIQEICTLTWKNLVEEGRHGGLRFVGKGQDGGKERLVPFTKKTSRIFREYCDWMEKFGRNKDSQYIFPSLGESHAQPGTIRNAIKIIAEKHPQLRGTTPHTLRHTFATLKISQCADPRWVQRVMGHKSKSMLYGYVHPSMWRNDELK